MLTSGMQAMKDGIAALLSLLRPHRALGRDKVRIGSAHDGGYVMLDDFTGIRSVIGCGVGLDVAFEFELAEKGLRVDLFDHTVAGPPRAHERFCFHRLRIAARASAGIAAVDLDDIARQYELPANSAVLKIDIEGDEWQLFAGASALALRPYRQIVCEFHWLENAGDPAWLARSLAAMRKLTADFAIVHVHANNYSPLLTIGDWRVPSVLELTFASRRHYRLRRSGEEFPTALDAANDPARPDYSLGRFDFDDRLTRRLWRRLMG